MPPHLSPLPPNGGEGRVRGVSEYKINVVSGIKPKQSEFWDEGIKRICKRLRILWC